MKKVMITVMATGVSVISFAQLNLGLQSTTQAAVNATTAATAATKATTVVTQVSSSTVNAGLNKATQLKTTGTSVVNAKSNQAQGAAADAKVTAKKAADINTGADLSSSVSANANAGNGNNASVHNKSQLNGGVNVNVNEGQLIDKTKAAANSTAKSTVETAQYTKAQATSEARSGVKDAKQTVAAVKPGVNANGEAEAKSAANLAAGNK